MTCREVMTPDPVCALGSDTARDAARLLESRNIGSVPVVEDQENKRMIGILTDRDLALRVVAAGLDPRDVPVTAIMNRELITCQAEDDSRQALETMARHQIRRIPVIDSDGLLIGIIAQADLARRLDPEQTGEVVSEISQPKASSGRNLQRIRPQDVDAAARAGTIAALAASAAGLGAGLMYFLDPARGRYRRLTVRDRASGFYQDSRDYAKRKQRQIQEGDMNKNTATRVAASAIGGGLVFYGLRSRSLLSRIALTAGFGLLARGVLNREINLDPARLAGLLGRS